MITVQTELPMLGNTQKVITDHAVVVNQWIAATNHSYEDFEVISVTSFCAHSILVTHLVYKSGYMKDTAKTPDSADHVG